MRCCSRSTTWRVSALLLFCTCATATPSAQLAAADETVARTAIIAAVQGKMGRHATVTLDRVSLSLTTPHLPASVVARPEPGSRTGRVIRFSLSAPGGSGRTLVGSATAVVHVAVTHVRTATLVPRGEIIDDTDLATVTADVEGHPLAPLPALADIVGGRAIRDLKAGDILTASLVKSQPLVKAGDVVRTVIRIGRVEAVGRAVAQQSGRRDDRIRLINPDSRRTMVGRVTGPGEVEVSHVL